MVEHRATMELVISDPLTWSEHVFDLPDGFGIDGLVGLSFLCQFNIELRLAEGRLLVDRVATT